MIEDKGLTRTGNPELSLEGREAVRSYILKWFLPLGVVVSIMAGLLGYFIRDVAVKRAEFQAYSAVQAEVIKMAQEVALAKNKAETTAGEIDKLKKGLEQSGVIARAFAAEMSELDKKFKTAAAFLATDDQVKAIARTVVDDPRLTQLFGEMKTTILSEVPKPQIHFIDAAADTAHGSASFEFPFAVKHAWVECAGTWDVPIHISVGGWGGKGVTVNYSSGELRRPERPYDKPWYRSLHYRVWATNF